MRWAMVASGTRNALAISRVREELLRLGEHAIRDRLAIFARAHALGLIGTAQALGGHELARCPELLREADHEGNVRLDVLLRPVGDLVRAVARGRSPGSRSRTAVLDIGGALLSRVLPGRRKRWKTLAFSGAPG
jgi:hypothetical protein